MFFRSHNMRQQFLIALGELFDGLVGVLSLGFFGSSLSFKILLWCTLKELEKRGIQDI